MSETAKTLNLKDYEIRIAEIIIDELKLENVTPEAFEVDMDLVDELGVDSMDLATIALVLQDEFDVEIPEDDYPKLTSVHLIAQFVREQVGD